MESYKELKSRHSEQINKFPMFFAFDNEQFKKGKESLRVTDNKELLSIYGGGFIRKTDKEEFLKMLNDQKEELKKAVNDKNLLFDGLCYELNNNEFAITGELDDTLRCFGLKEKDLTLKQEKILNRAIENYKKRCN